MVKGSTHDIYSFYLNSLSSVVTYLFRHVMSNQLEMDKHVNKHCQVTFEPENGDIWMIKDSTHDIDSYYLNSNLRRGQM